MLTLNRLMGRGIPLANMCFLCEKDEDTIDHLLIHCSRAKMLWDLILVIVDVSWVPLTVQHSLLAWQGPKVGKKRKRVLDGNPSLFILDFMEGKE